MQILKITIAIIFSAIFSNALSQNGQNFKDEDGNTRYFKIVASYLPITDLKVFKGSGNSGK